MVTHHPRRPRFTSPPGYNHNSHNHSTATTITNMPPPHHTTFPTTRGELTSTTNPHSTTPTPSGELTFTPHTTQKNTHQHFHTIRHPKEHYRQQATATQNSLQPPHTKKTPITTQRTTPSTTLITISVVDKHQKNTIHHATRHSETLSGKHTTHQGRVLH